MNQILKDLKKSFGDNKLALAVFKDALEEAESYEICKRKPTILMVG